MSSQTGWKSLWWCVKTDKRGKECPYQRYRKQYNMTEQGTKRPQLKNRIRPAQEMDVQNIMTAYNCNYDDVVEAVDLYNMNMEDSQTERL